MKDPEIARLDAEYGGVGAAPRRGGPRPWLAVVIGLLDRFWGLATVLSLALALHVYILYDAWSLTRASEMQEPSGGPAAKPGSRWLLYAGFIVVSVTIVGPGSRWLLPVRTFAYAGANMAPALRLGDHFMVRKGTFGPGDLRRGDVVAFQSVEDRSALQVDRIVGLPGETIDIVDKAVSVNGQRLDEERYAHFDDLRTYPDSPALPQLFRARDQFGPARVPDGQVLLLGDNRDNSYDSRFFGPVPIANVRGRLLYVY